jgi:choline-glycine betaine transporter
MTAGGTGSLILYDYMLGRDWKNDGFVKAGMNWMTVHYDIQPWNTYYLYALERAGILYGAETFGTHVWYKDGALALLGSQATDGSWGKDTDWFNTCWDTCFSIPFLRRATRPLTPTEAAGRLKK